MSEPLWVHISARTYEVDINAHVAATVLLQYAHHARWECLRAAGVDLEVIRGTGLGPVSLEENIRFHRELRAGQELDVSCEYRWGDGKTFRVRQELLRSDGVMIAEVTNVGGLMDHRQRRLVARPAAHWRRAARAPELLGLEPTTT